MLGLMAKLIYSGHLILSTFCPPQREIPLQLLCFSCSYSVEIFLLFIKKKKKKTSNDILF